MSLALDSYLSKPTAVFEGLVKDVEFHVTVKGDAYALVFVRGEEKPLAIPQKGQYTIPNRGDHISARDVTNGLDWIFVGHRSVVTIKHPDFEVWRTPGKVDESQEEQAEDIILNYLKLYDDKGCSPNDVRQAILAIFLDRDPHIVGIPFLRLSKKQLIHKFGELPSDDRRHHGSDVSVWHLTEKGRKHILTVAQ